MRYWLLMLFVVCLATSSAHADVAGWVLRRAAESTVRVVLKDSNGSGSIVATRGEYADILTCAHVVGSNSSATIHYDADGEKTTSAFGIVVSVDAVHDLALIRARNPKHRPSVPVSDSEPELYDELYTVAAPLGVQRRAAIERLSAKDSKEGWGVSGMIIGGMSGSAMLDERGRLVCVTKSVNTFNDDEYTQLGYCIPLPTVRAFLKGASK